LVEVAYKSGLTLKVLTISILMIILACILNTWLMTRTMWWLYAGVLPVHMIYVVIINELLGRISPRLRLSKEELCILFTAFFAIGGYSYSMYGELKFGINIISNYVNLLGPIRALNVEPLRSYQMNKIYPLWAPPLPVAEKAWNGLLPGEAIDWGAWLAPLFYWTFWFITWTIWSYLLAFMLRKQMVEVERLPFAMVLPSALPILWSTEPKESPWNIFNLKNITAKIFWVAAIIGFFCTFSDIINYFIPAVPASGEWTTIYVNLNTMTRSILPGASFYGIILLPRIPVFALCSTDVLLSGVLAWFAMMIVYPAIGVRIGMLPYTPGWEDNPWQYGQNIGPIRSIYAVNTGITLGIGVWILFIARDHIKQIFASLIAKGKSTAVTEEQGVKYSLVALSFIALSIIMLLIMVASGVPAIIAILFLLCFFIIEAGNTYSMGEYPWLTDNNWLMAPLGYYTGLAMGLWGTEMPNPSVSAARTVAFASFFNVRYISYHGHELCGAFKVADITKTKAKDVLIMMIICAIVSGVFANVFSVWWINRHGMKNLSYNIPFGGLSDAYVRSSFVITSDIFLSHTIGGLLITLLIFALRLRFTWFILNPLGIALALFSPTWYAFPNMLIALLIRWLSIRIGGIKFFEEKVVPFLIGWTCGYSINYIIVMWLAFLTKAVPAGF